MWHSCLTIFILIIFAMPLSGQSAAMEEDTIKKIITDETVFFAQRDLKAWSECYLPVPYVRWTALIYENKRPVVMSVDNWMMLYNGMRAYFRSQEGQAIDPIINSARMDWNIQIRGNVAWVKFIQKNFGLNEASHEVRVLEKQNGKWRIVLVSSIAEMPEQ
jgi:hypothetical protein